MCLCLLGSGPGSDSSSGSSSGSSAPVRSVCVCLCLSLYLGVSALLLLLLLSVTLTLTLTEAGSSSSSGFLLARVLYYSYDSILCLVRLEKDDWQSGCAPANKRPRFRPTEWRRRACVSAPILLRAARCSPACPRHRGGGPQHSRNGRRLLVANFDEHQHRIC